MVASISPDPRLQFFASDGSFLVGGKLYTYAAGTTTPLATYTSSSGSTANTNPVVLNSRGETSVWLGSSQYKFVLKDANDVEIWTQDNLQAGANVDGSNATGTWPISITGNAATATLATTATYATTAGSVTPGNAVTSITGAGLYGFTLPGGPITSSGTLTVTPPAPSTAGNVLTSNGSVWVSQALAGTSNLQSELFTASGTWTSPAGATKVRVTVIGGGSGAANYVSYGAPGGAAVGVYTVTPSTPYTVTVGLGSAGVSSGTSGAGGTSSFGILISATGGSGASNLANGTAGVGSSGNLTNSYAFNFNSVGGAVPYFRTSGLMGVADTGVNAAQTYNPVWSLSAAQAGVGGDLSSSPSPVNGGIGGIVYVEWVG